MSIRCIFMCLYGVYNSKLGRWFHNCMIRNRHERRLRSGLGLDHSRVDKELIDFYSVKIKIVPLGRTNFSYFIQDAATGQLAVVDPGDPDYLISIAENFFKTPISLALLTHKHWDHSAGLKKLKDYYPNLKSCASKEETAFEITNPLADGEMIALGSTQIKLIYTPVHTKGSSCFFIEPERTSSILFTGDTLFVGGMGAFFEGDYRMACSSISKILGLPDDTYMFPGHEYADTTLKFAKYLQPNNRQLDNKISWVVKRRARYMVTIPSTLKEEKSYNPFLRIYDTSFYVLLGVRHYLEAISKLQELRMKKRNEYRYIELKVHPEAQ